MGSFSLLRILADHMKAVDIGLAVLGYIACHYFLQRNVRGPRMWPLLGMMPSLFFHANRVYDWLTEILIRCGGTFTFKGPSLSSLFCVVTADPSNLAHLLKFRFCNFPKGPYFRSVAHDFLGDGIFNADDEMWRRQRRTANVQFNSSDFKAFMASTVQGLVRERLVPLLNEACARGGVIDLQDVLMRFTFDNVCLMALGTDPGCLTLGAGLKDVGFARAFEDATAATMVRFLIPMCLWRLMKLLDVGPERELRVSLAAVHEFAEKAIVSRKGRRGTRQADLLSAFMEIKDEAGRAVYSDKVLRDVSVNFILAGRDTSSVALSWFFWLVLRHPGIEQRILAEIQSILNKRAGDDSVNFSLEELKQMQYLQAALSESLRLYPSVPIDHKEVGADDCFPDGTYLKKGTKVLYSIYSMGRMESIWGEDCLEFRPERWIDEKGAFVSESVFKYPVFNGGPRLCLGKDFAYIQMKWIAATVIWGFRLKLVPGHLVEPKLALTLYMKNGLLVTLEPRHGIHC